MIIQFGPLFEKIRHNCAFKICSVTQYHLARKSGHPNTTQPKEKCEGEEVKWKETAA